MIIGLIGFGIVVVVATALSRNAQPEPASGMLAQPLGRPARVTVAPSPAQAAAVLVAAGAAFAGSIILVWSSLTTPPDYGISGNNVVDSTKIERHFHAGIAYGIVVILPALIVLSVCMLMRRRSVQGLARESRRHWFTSMNPIYREAYRVLGRSTAWELVATGAVPAVIAWAVARHYGA